MRCANEDENKKENKSKKWMFFIVYSSACVIDFISSMIKIHHHFSIQMVQSFSIYVIIDAS